MKNQNVPGIPDGVSVSSVSSLIVKVSELAEAGQLDDALRLLSRGSVASPEIQNARAVCLMRAGRFNEAVRVFRFLVLAPGCTWMKPDLPVIFRTNFSTALLLAGLSVGGRDTLAEITHNDHPSVIRLRQAICTWEKKLSWWQFFNWKFGIAPRVPISIDFVPGEFVDPTTTLSTPRSLNQETSHMANQQVA